MIWTVIASILPFHLGISFHVRYLPLKIKERKGFQGFFSWAMHREAEHPSSTHA
jgi:hypothetical protein